MMPLDGNRRFESFKEAKQFNKRLELPKGFTTLSLPGDKNAIVIPSKL